MKQHAVSRKAFWAGWVASALPVLMMVFSGVLKLMRPEPVIESFQKLGYSPDLAIGLGVLELSCVAVYLLPRTAVLGAVLMTGYLGGAVNTHLRIGDPLLTHTLFPIYLGALAWIGLLLREKRLRALLPFRKQES
jgi:hypothetical protein